MTANDRAALHSHIVGGLVLAIAVAFFVWTVKRGGAQ